MPATHRTLADMNHAFAAADTTAIPAARLASRPSPSHGGEHQLPALESLLGGMTAEDFFAGHWRTRALHVPQASRSCFEAVLPLTAVDRLFADSVSSSIDWLFLRAVEGIENESFIDAQGQVELSRLYALYRGGGTIQLRNTQRHLPSIDRFWRAITERFRTKVKINLWVTSHNEFKPYLHYDTHDIFILQLHGRKQWTLYDLNPSLFAPRAGDVSLDRRDVGEPAQRITIEAGDMLYVPAGMPHEVTTCDPHSLHLAVGVFPLLWRDVLDDALADLDGRGSVLSGAVPQALLAGDDGVALHSALRGVLLRAAYETRAATLRERAETRYIDAQRPPVDGHFMRELLGAGPDQQPPVQAGMRLRRRGNAAASVKFDARGERASIRFHGGGEVAGPAELGPLLNAIATAPGMFTPDDLPDDYDLASRALLLNELLQLGFLERAL